MRSSMADKALIVLDFLIEHPDGARQVELLRHTTYPPATLHRVLGALVRHDFVRQEASRGRYTLGHKFVQAFNRMVRGLRLQEVALPHLKRLAQMTGEAANLGVLRGNDLVVLECIVADRTGPVMYSPPGTVVPPHCSAMGKVTLANLSGPDFEQCLQTLPLTPLTPRSITEKDTLVDHLAQVRQRGYAIDDEEYHLGVRCVAAAVRDFRGRVIAAMSVSAPVPQLTVQRIPIIADLVTQTARAMSADLGHEAALADSAPSSRVASKAE